jgi:hypothetical protein
MLHDIRVIRKMLQAIRKRGLDRNIVSNKFYNLFCHVGYGPTFGVQFNDEQEKTFKRQILLALSGQSVEKTLKLLENICDEIDTEACNMHDN